MDALAEVEPVAILTALGFLEPTAVERITGGADARIWRFETGGKAYALRVLRPEQKEQARIEMAVGAAAASAGLPVPAVVAAGSWRHHPVHVLDWSPGAPLAHVLQHGAIDLRRARALGIAFGKVQAAIHAVPVPDELADRSLRWQAWGGPDPELQRVLADLPEQRPALLHLDYHPMNVLVEDDRVTAVLDWANARAGDPRADFARTLSIVQLVALPSGPDAAARSVRRVFEAGWRDGYGEDAGRLEPLAPYCWWAGEVMIHEFSPRLDRPDFPWLTAALLDQVRAWTARWRKRSLSGLV